VLVDCAEVGDELEHRNAAVQRAEDRPLVAEIKADVQSDRRAERCDGERASREQMQRIEAHQEAGQAGRRAAAESGQ
jgi:hypothetical protein